MKSFSDTESACVTSSAAGSPIYLDYNATTPVDPAVAAAMQPYIDTNFGNPSSGHVYGRTTHDAVDTARGQIAGLLGCAPAEIVFTGGGSEANNHAIKGVADALRDRGNHIITSAIEHPAVTEVCAHLAAGGFDITYVPVDNDGLVDPRDVAAAITERTILVTVMHANNEVGTIQPVAEIGAITRQRQVLFHTDAAQSIGKVPVDVEALNVDLLSIAGHKLYAPKGVGALYIRDGVSLTNLIHGAAHESGRRAGTENVIHIVGLGKACELIQDNRGEHSHCMFELRQRLEAALLAAVPDSRVNGHCDRRLPNTLSIGFKGRHANELLDALPGIAASTGAACHSGEVSISPVLTAMQVPAEFAAGTLRLSVGRFTTEAEIDQAIEQIMAVLGGE